MSKSDDLACLRGIFRDDGNCFRLAEVLYDLAAETQYGNIAEVGTANGIGAISLALGTRASARLPVYAIDPLVPVRGWANEPYGPELRREWYQNVLAAGVAEQVILVGLPVQLLGQWPDHAGLTFWDLGLSMKICGGWLQTWLDAATQHGDIVAINETGGDDLDVDRWLEAHHVLKVREIRHRVRVCVKL